jgi:DNA polymerase-3 subunit alpha
MLQAVDNSYVVADKAASISIKHKYHLPKIPIPASIKAKTSDYNEQLQHLLIAKAKEHGRWSDDPVYIKRFEKEFDVIAKNSKLNFLPYFLMYEDICKFARESGILQNIGRGSAGGCLISYLLKIIHIDPIKENLPFERFLSHARINANSFPDIDLDLGQRGPILEYLKEKYGVGFAQIGTFLKFKTKNAIKDAMYAVYGRNRNDKEIMDVCDSIPDSPQGVDEYDFLYGYTDSEGEEHKGNIEQNQMLRMFFAQYPEIEQVVKRLIGLPKDFGRHPSAFVISTLDLASERVPLSLMEGESGPIWVTHFEAQMVEKSGLVKADILGVVTINTIAECVAMIKDRTGSNLLEEDDKGVQLLYRLPEDSGVYTDFYRRKTDSSFQFNTDLIKGFLEQFAPTSRKDLSDLTALCRPGALDVKFLPGVSATQFYIDARSGLREPEYVHEDLEPILKETNGVVVYQEQLMQILVEFCGYSLEESDQIRSAIAKKKRDVMLKAYERVRESTGKRGWTLEQANRLCEVLEAYSNYSFNKAHACIAPNQLIKTDVGLVPMANITINSNVATYENDKLSYAKPVDVWVTGYKPVYEIELEDGSLMNMTADHMVLTNIGWIEVIKAFEMGLDVVCVKEQDVDVVKT